MSVSARLPAQSVTTPFQANPLSQDTPERTLNRPLAVAMSCLLRGARFVELGAHTYATAAFPD
eukprot:6162334-Alexandrium_andersonii.AAC.1